MSGIVFLTNIERQYSMMEQARKIVVQQGCLQSEGQTIFLKDDLVWNREWEETFRAGSIVLLSLMGTSRDTEFVKKATAFIQEQDLTHAILASVPHPGDTYQGVTSDALEIMSKYLSYSGLTNYANFWLWLGGTYCHDVSSGQPPQPLLWNGIFHPRSQQPFTDQAQYRRQFCCPDRPTVGIVFPRDEWVWSDVACPAALVAEIERQGMNAIAVFSSWAHKPELQVPGIDETVRQYFYADGVPAIDVLINTFKFSLTVGRPVDQEFLRKLNVPVLQAYTLIQSCEDWKSSMTGMTITEISCIVAMPEFDGVIHAVPVAGKEHLPDGSTRHQVMPERIVQVVNKARKWAQLRRKDNHEKKIAIVFHNYPPQNSNIGSAVGLDSPESVRLLLQHMLEWGYAVDHIPTDSQALMNELLANATNDRRFLTDEQIANAPGNVTDEQYRLWFQALAPENQQQLTADWGPPPGEVFHYDSKLLMPGMLNGNIFLTVQPPRGFGEDPGKIYHSPDCAPTHHYLAYYHWLRDIWQADAVIHVGTHGSLEWLPGKGAGLSQQCYPDLALGDLPNIYPYLITIVGEGLQAKRRGSACLIGHLTPPVSHADTYAELAELEKLLDDYAHFKQNQLGNIGVVSNLIREKVKAVHLDQDIPEQAEQSFDDYVQQLHACITDIKNMQIRVGLHVLGCPPQKETLVEYVLALTRMDNGKAPSLLQTVASMYGYDYYQLLEQSGKLLPDGSKTYGVLLDEIRHQCREFVIFLAEHDFASAQVKQITRLPLVGKAGAVFQEKLLQVAHYICQHVVPSLQKTEQEITNTLQALADGFIEPGPAGAPTSGMADILPTGRNFYGVDPSALPSPVAWEIGRQLGDNVIERYIAEEGRYPEEIGMILWSGANMRSHGQCIAEFLYLLGVCPVWQQGSQRVTGLTVMPLTELKRPRIDVTARISGLFRDTLPAAMVWMDKAVALVAELDESPQVNYIRKHVLQDVAQIEEQEGDNSQAWEQACYRVFGCPPGTYGAGVGQLLEEKNWQTVDDLAKGYVRWGGHAYGVNAAGTFVPDLFSRRLENLDVTVKNEDNREVHMLNSDDFNAYHGGMIASVRSLKGKAPRSYCGDSSDRQKVMLRSIDEEVKRLFRGEVMNPKFIEGMKRHGYKGAADLAGVVAHCYGWDTTSQVMENWMYEDLAQKYALDASLQEWMQEVNPWALRRIAEKLLEASQRGLWQANKQTKRELEQLYLSIEGELEERGDVVR
ncbi:MAG TPA: cobaltochelatase subunit CobN [Negativicutes bacterium]